MKNEIATSWQKKYEFSSRLLLVLLMNHQESLYVANVRLLYNLCTFSSTIWYINRTYDYILRCSKKVYCRPIMYMIVLFVHWSTPSTFMKKGHYPVDNDSLSYSTCVLVL
jgi:hypothetical protein